MQYFTVLVVLFFVLFSCTLSLTRYEKQLEMYYRLVVVVSGTWINDSHVCCIGGSQGDELRNWYLKKKRKNLLGCRSKKYVWKRLEERNRGKQKGKEMEKYR